MRPEDHPGATGNFPSAVSLSIGDEGEDTFDEIAQKACAEAAAVNCSPDDYRTGLRHIIDELKTALDAATPRKR